MSRHLITIYGEADRQRAHAYVKQAPAGTRVEFKAIKRSLPQNDLFWSILTDIAAQKAHYDRRYPPETWKALFMHAWQRELSVIPSLDGKEFVPLSRSSDLSRQEMSELIDFITCWAAENGIVLNGQSEVAEAPNEAAA